MSRTLTEGAVDMILKDRNYDGAIVALKDFQIKYPKTQAIPPMHIIG